MSLNLTDLGGGQWAIEENNQPDAYVRSEGGQFRLVPNASGGCWINRDGLSYSLDPAGQDFMAVTSEIVTAGDTAVPLNTASPSGVTLFLKNTSANAADLGGSDVAGAAGFALAAGATAGPIALKPGDVLYAIRTASSDATIAVLRT